MRAIIRPLASPRVAITPQHTARGVVTSIIAPTGVLPTFYILTEAGDRILTEAGDLLRTE